MNCYDSLFNIKKKKRDGGREGGMEGGRERPGRRKRGCRKRSGGREKLSEK